MSFFDPKTFTAGGFLDAQVGDITSATITKFDYNGKVDPPANVVEVEVRRADGKTRRETYGTGAAGTEDGNNFTGPLHRTCKFAQWLGYLAKTKFPFAKLNTEGVGALVGHRFVWKNIGKDKDFFVPDQYVGVADGDAVAVQQEEDDLRDLVGTMVLACVRENGNGGLKKTALTQKMAAKLEKTPDVKLRALPLITQDSYLAQLPGVSLDKGILTLIAE